MHPDTIALHRELDLRKARRLYGLAAQQYDGARQAIEDGEPRPVAYALHALADHTTEQANHAYNRAHMQVT